MKTTVGQLRRIISEVSSEGDVTDQDGFHVGDWFCKHDGTDVGQLIRLFHVTFRHNGKTNLMARQSTAQGSREQLFSVWSRDRRRATAAEVEEAEASWGETVDDMRRTIDTSREGT